jgi:predicted permease
VSKTSVNDVLKEGGRGVSGSRRAQWLSGTMVVIEIALTLVLLAGAGLMAKSFLKLYSRDLGIRADYLLTMRVALPNAKYSTPEARLGFFDRLRPRLDALPGAESVAAATSVPPQGSGQRHLEIEGRPVEPGRERTSVTTVTIDQTFFDTVGAPVVRGRNFTAADGAPGSETVLVNPRFVSEHMPGEDPIGRRIRFVARESAANTPPGGWRTIVGISPALIHNNPRDTAPAAVVYLPFRQESPGFAYLLVRSRLEPAVMINAVRREVQAIDPDQPVFTFQTIAQMLRQQQWPYRVFGTVFGIFAVIALTLAAVGLYAVMAYSVTQRTQEIGVRMALGAAGRHVSWLILRRGIVQLGIGLTLGIAGAWFASRALRPILFDTPPNDPATFVGISLLLSIVALSACLVPARRATRLDPLVALRRE